MATNSTTPVASVNNAQPPRQPSAADLPPPANHSAAPVPAAKKGKNQKAKEPVDPGQAVMDKIKQLESSKADEKEQEQEIEREVKKSTREMRNMLSTLPTENAKIDALQKKCNEYLANWKRAERDLQSSKKKADLLQKERDQAKTQLGKVTAERDTFTNTTRTMQKENKKLKEDHRTLVENETQMREELHEKLESMVTEMQTLIMSQEHPEELPANRESDDLFRAKFKSFVEQYELREIQFQSILRMKELEVQYQLARYENQRKAQEQDANKNKQLTSQVSTFSQTETELRSQLNIYVEKFKQVEDTLNNSNDLFLTFRKEMEEMSKKTKKLEKENHNLTRKHELTSSNILKMAEERTPLLKEMEALRKKNEKLETLCRGMQMQGRGRPEMMAVNGAQAPAPVRQQGPQSESAQSESEERTESEYSYEDEDEEEDDEDDDVDEEASEADDEVDSDDLEDESEFESPVMQHAAVQATNGQQQQQQLQSPHPQHPGNQTQYPGNQVRPQVQQQQTQQNDHFAYLSKMRLINPETMTPREQVQHLQGQIDQARQYVQQRDGVQQQQQQASASAPRMNNKDRTAMPPPPLPLTTNSSTAKVQAVKNVRQPVVNGVNGKH